MFHQNESGLYNYSDFNLEECTYAINSNGTEYTTKPLSNLIFYNSGSHKESIFGICKHIDGYSNGLNNQCQVIGQYTSTAQKIEQAGKLNAGAPLTQFVDQIGKLSFIQPHTHMIPGDTKYGVNIHGDTGKRQYHIIAYSELDPWFKGTWSMKHVYEWPRYNMSLNTVSMIQNKNEFISTVDCKLMEAAFFSDKDTGTNWYNDAPQRVYTGFSGDQLAIFNEKMLKTLKSVYALNPDYSNLTQNIGTVSIVNPNFKFTAYLINKYSELEYKEKNKKFNDYIYLHSLSISEYINHLLTYIDTLDEKNVNFQPNYKYCGTENKPYLISELNYQLPVNNDISEDLTMTSSDLIVVKHSDGTKTILKGELNPHLLYGFDTNSGKLVQLDVANYKIDSDGELIITRKQFEGKNYTYYLTPSKQINILPDTIFGNTFKLEGVSLKYNFSVVDENNEISNVPTITDNNDIYVIVPKNNRPSTKLNVNLELEGVQNIPFDYNFEISEITLSCTGTLLDNDTFNKVSLAPDESFDLNKNPDTCTQIQQLSISDCKQLLTEVHNESNLVFKTGCSADIKDLYAKYNSEIFTEVEKNPSNRIFLNGVEIVKNTFETYNYPVSFNMNTYSITNAKFNNISENNILVNVEDGYELYKFTIQNVKYSFTKTESYEKNPKSVILTNTTKTYSEFNKSQQYEVLSQYKDAQFRGTSLTINDLYYIPNSDSHRLFIKNIAKYISYYRNKLYYRTYIPSDPNNEEGVPDYNEKDYKELGVLHELSKDLNTLFLYTGPCFTENNL